MDHVELFGENETVVQSVWKIFDMFSFIEDELDYIINTDRLAILLDVPKDNPKVDAALNELLNTMVSADVVEKAHLFAIAVEEAINDSPNRTVGPDVDLTGHLHNDYMEDRDDAVVCDGTFSVFLEDEERTG